MDRRNLVRVDPLDPHRMLVQSEAMYPYTRTNILMLHTIPEGGPTLGKFDEALEKFYEWYPVVHTTAEKRADGRYYLTHGPVRPVGFAEDVANNEVITSQEEFVELMKRNYREQFSDKYVFGPRMYKVALPPGQSDSLLSGRTAYVLLCRTEHLVADGKSHRVFRNFINAYLKDKSYKPHIEHPQEVIRNMAACIPESASPRPIPIVETSFQRTFEFDRCSKVPWDKRGIQVKIRRFPKSAFKRPAGCSLTAALSSYHTFLYTNLLLDHDPSLAYAAASVSAPYTIDHTGFKKIMEGCHEEMLGNDVSVARSCQPIFREAPKTLYQVLASMKQLHKVSKNNAAQQLINAQFMPFVDTSKEPGYERLNNIVTNVGNAQLESGPLDGFTGYMLSPHNIGCILVAFIGQGDGSIMFTTTGQETSFQEPFMKLFGDIFIRLGELAEKRDVTRDELVAMPEYRELLTYIL